MIGYLVYEIATGNVLWGAQCEPGMFPPSMEEGHAVVRWSDWQHEELYYVDAGEVREREPNPAKVKSETVAAFGEVTISDIPQGCQVIADQMYLVDLGTFRFTARKGMNRITLMHPRYLDRVVEVRGI